MRTRKIFVSRWQGGVILRRIIKKLFKQLLKFLNFAARKKLFKFFLRKFGHGKGSFFKGCGIGAGGMFLLHVLPHDDYSGAGWLYRQPGRQQPAHGDHSRNNQPGFDRLQNHIRAGCGQDCKEKPVVVGCLDDVRRMHGLRPDTGDRFAACRKNRPRHRIRLLLGFAGHNISLAGAAIFMAGGFGIICSESQATAMAMTDNTKRGLANNTYLIGLDSGMALGPIVGGFLYGHVPAEFFYPCLMVTAVLSTIVYIMEKRKLGVV